MPTEDGMQAILALYRIMQSTEGKLGGGEGVEGLYGSITQSGMQRILSCLSVNCGLGTSSSLVDVGAGLGRPLLHALLWPGVCKVQGVEVDPVKCAKAKAFAVQTLAALAKKGIAIENRSAPEYICSPVEKVDCLGCATHAYSFWEGIPVVAKEAFGKLFRLSCTLKAVAVVQRGLRKEHPAAMMQELGFGPLLFIKQLPVNMSGSGRSFTAYIFSKITPESAALLARTLPAPCTQDSAASAATSVELEADGTQGEASSEASPAKRGRPAADAMASPSKISSPRPQPHSTTPPQQHSTAACSQEEGSPSKRSRGALQPLDAPADAPQERPVALLQTAITHSYSTRRKLAMAPLPKAVRDSTVSIKGSAAAPQGFGLAGAGPVLMPMPTAAPEDTALERRSGRQRAQK